ncbi:MAG: hypothetical protein ACI9E1_002320 [Cryomorphaceae bacterium]|jgi:hypothetical protein
MEPLPQSHQEKIWTHHARSISKKLNLAWWVEQLNLPLAITALLAAVGILAARYFDHLPSYFLSISVLLLAVSAIAYFCWLASRKKFEKPDESLVRIEDKMKLRNALSAAKAGVAPWPEAPAEIDAGVSRHWPRTLLPSLCSILVIIAAFFIPIGSHAEEMQNHQSPDARDSLEQALEELKDEEIVQEEYIEEVAKKIDELKKQDPNEWFSHSSLEAVDNLTKSHDAASKELQRNMQNAERTLQNLQKHGDKLNQQTKENLLDDFGKAVENMDTGAMKPNQELLDQLKKIDPKQLNQLNEEQLNQLRENMRKMAEKLKQQQKNGDDGEDGDGDGEGGDKREPGQPGKGGIGRGPGHAPGMLGNEAEKLELNKEERLKSNDLSNTLPGDLLETTDGEHDIDKSNSKTRSGGGTENKGAGGERVWKNSLLPEEKKAIKKFFK